MAKHKCAAIGCKKEISLAIVMCRDCWPLVPRELGKRILNHQHDWDQTLFRELLEEAKAHLLERRGGVDNSVQKPVDKSRRVVGVDKS